MVLVLGIVKASLEILGIGIGIKKWYFSCLITTITTVTTTAHEKTTQSVFDIFNSFL